MCFERWIAASPYDCFGCCRRFPDVLQKSTRVEDVCPVQSAITTLKHSFEVDMSLIRCVSIRVTSRNSIQQYHRRVITTLAYLFDEVGPWTTNYLAQQPFVNNFEQPTTCHKELQTSTIRLRKTPCLKLGTSNTTRRAKAKACSRVESFQQGGKFSKKRL